MSDGLAKFFMDDHRAIDKLWAEVEGAVEAGDDGRAKACFTTFRDTMLRHLKMEEEVLFPAFEQATGMRGGPTQVMRMEHEQMRGLLSQMSGLADAGDLSEVVDQGDTLLMLIQQHNSKEEGILYPMAEQHLSGDWEQLKSRLEAV